MPDPRPDPTAVRSTTDGGLARITLTAPERSNRITVGAMLALIEALEAVRGRAAVLVLDAEGPDFCLGRDQGERDTGLTRDASLRLILRANDLLGGFEGTSVSLVRGRAFGFGSGLALHTDITLASDRATLGFDEVVHGLAPLVVVGYLARFVGPKVAAELLATGREVPAAEAQALRMVNRVVADADLEAEGDRLASELVAHPPGALRLMKRYALDHAAGRLPDPEDAAVRRLDEWLTAGRPEHP